jgi:hypothetical protein
VRVRFYIDPETGEPHIWRHHVSCEEAIEILARPIETRASQGTSRVANGRTAAGRYLRVIYVPDPEPFSVFVVTGWQLEGQSLKGMRRRMKRKR